MQKPSITIVVPIYEGVEFLNELLDAIKSQSIKAEETIFVVSKSRDSDSIESKLSHQESQNIKYKLVDRLYPGEARNLGVELSKSTWIAFLDLRTLPSKRWLESLIKASDNGRYEFVGALRTCVADTPYKRILKASTYGNAPSNALSGSLVSRKLFNSSKGFVPNVRAGEDLEWISRISRFHDVTWLDESLIVYSGLPSNLFQTIKKWFRYSYESSKVNVVYGQKFSYFVILLILILYFSYTWNFIFTFGEWDQSPYFIPHLNKILWGVSLCLYLFYRGLIRPILFKENLNYLLPLNWAIIGLNGIILDLTKAPGRLIGFFKHVLRNKSMAQNDNNRTKKILFVCPYPPNLAAGQRLKFEPHFDSIEREGCVIQQSCFMSRRFWHIAYKPGHYTEKVFWTIKGCIERIFLLFSLPRYDTVYIFMNVFPFGPAILERLFRIISRRIIYDIEDNIIADESNDDRRIISFLKSKKKYEFLIKKSDVVIASTPALAEKCNQISGSKKSMFIPPTLNDNVFFPRTTSTRREKLTIGWTGTFSSKPFLDIVLPALESLYKERDFKMKIIGNFEMENPALDLEVVQWNEENETNDLQDIDIGLYPLPEDEWVIGKSGLKAMQYMSIGIPTLCSAVGHVPNIIEDGVDGILVFKESEWKEKLKDIMDDEMKRKIIGKNARKTFLTNYSKKSITKLYLKALG